MRLTRFAAAAPLAAAGLLFSSPAAAQHLAVPQHVPEGTMGVISVRDTPAMWRAIQTSPVRQRIDTLLQLPAIQSDPDVQEGLLMFDKAEAGLGYSVYPDSLMIDTIEGFDLHLLPPAGMGAAAETLLIVDFQEASRAQAMADYITSVYEGESQAQIDADLQPFQINEQSIGDVEIVSIPEQDVHYGVSGDLLFFGSSTQAITRAAESEGGATLTGSPEYQEAVSSLEGAEGQLFVFLSEESLGHLGQVSQMLPMNGMDLPDTGGREFVMLADFTPDRVNGVYRYRYNPSTSVTATCLDAQNGELGPLLNLLPASPMVSYGMNFLRGNDYIDCLTEMAGSPDSIEAQQANQMIMQAEMVASMLGLSLRNDVLPAFGPHMAVGINDLRFQGLQDINADALLVLQVADRAKATQVVETLESALLAQVNQQAQQRGMETVDRQTIPTPDGNSITGVPFQNANLPIEIGLYHSFSPDGFLLIGLTPDTVAEALARGPGSASQTLATSPGWNSFQQFAPAEVSDFAVVDLGRIGSLASNFLPLLMGFGQGNAADLQMAQALADILKSAGTFYSTSRYGEDWRSGHLSLIMR